jgi:hypothetical protein
VVARFQQNSNTKVCSIFFPKLVCFLFIFFFYIEGNELIICLDLFV